MTEHNPEKTEHQKLEGKVKEKIKSEDDPVPTPKIAESCKSLAYSFDWSDAYYRNHRIPMVLEYLKEEGEIEVVKETREGGHPTYNWGIK